MSFLSTFFGKKQTSSVALLDISSGSIGCGYAVVATNGVPKLLYTLRVPIEPHTTESAESAMERTLKEAGNQLVKEGAPILFRATGSGSADMVLGAISAPWQDTLVRTEQSNEKRPFTFTKSFLDRVVSKSSSVAPDRILVDESVLGTLLNGYVVQKPFGKKVSHAGIVVLTSTLAKKVAMTVAEILRGLFHTKEIVFISGTSLRYQVLCSVFFHEKNYLILDATGPEVSVALVRNGIMTATRDLKSVVESEARWTEEVHVVLRELAQEYPLPHSIFLVAPEKKRTSLKEALMGSKFGSLWLSDVPPNIIVLAPQQFDAFAKHVGDTDPDLSLLLMTLHAQTTFSGNDASLSTL